MRIHIIGGPGSGKTTLARQLSIQHKTPYYELDVIGWEEGSGPERSQEQRLADIQQIVSRPSWITEGSFLGWTDKLFQHADKIIWLDLPWRIARWRIVTRHIKASLACTNRHKGLLKLYRFVHSSREYYSDPGTEGRHTRAAAAHYLQNYTEKLYPCRRPSEVTACIQQIETDGTSSSTSDESIA